MASSSSKSCNFDVFLSFRGEDTRKTFVDHLYSALVDRLISTYKDDETLPRGESIGPSLLKAIEGSQIAVVIFSKNYANSSWCLDELAYIMKCNDERKLIVMPVFYDVVPSEVRKQEGDFGRGFAEQVRVNTYKADLWNRALVDASNISGWEPKNIANGHESKVIKDIVNAITNKLFFVNSRVDEDLVGMSSRLQELKEQLDTGSRGVRMVGIWGVGGGGKTTLASSLYMQISRHFQCHCIINNIREEARKDGLLSLQEKLLLTLTKTEINLQSIEEGKHMISSRLKSSNILIILDDVDHINQLDALAGSHDWYGSGSRVVITTRDEHLLRTHKIDVVFPIRLLSNEEAIQLFNKRAYNEIMSVKNYDTLSLRVASYAAGLPLALRVLGSFLYDKEEKEWMSTINRLQDTSQTEILEQLKISYDGLESDEKEIFLDIACFFRFSLVNYAMERLEACGYHLHIGIRVLRQKALITIVDGMLNMHDLIQEMGQHIVRGKHPNNPEKHSRLWKNEEITNMYLSHATKNNKIKAVICRDVDHDHILQFYKSVSNMKKLKLLQMTVQGGIFMNSKRAKEAVFLSNELRYINVGCYPRSMFPNTFNPVKLVVLKIYQSKQKHLWKGCKHLPHLKVLQLDSMKNLFDTPDFSGLPNLQKLRLVQCDSLETIHPSLGEHKSVEEVVVRHCEKLRMFPTIIHMKKLKTLEIRSSSDMFIEFPEIKSNMDSLEKLSMDSIGIDALLPSIGERCANLISLRLYWCFYSTSIEVNFGGLKHLDELELYKLDYMNIPENGFTRRWLFFPSQLRCNLRKLQLIRLGLNDGEIHFSGIGELSNLEELNLSYNDITQLGFTLSQLTRLEKLNISKTMLVELPKLPSGLILLDISSTQVVELPKLPSSLIVLRADECIMLTIMRDSFINCKRLCYVSLMEVRMISDCSQLLESMLQGNGIQAHCMRLRLDGIKIAKEFIPPLLMKGDRCRVNLSENWRNDFSGFLICGVVNTFTYIGHVSMKEVTDGMEFEDEVVNWEESDDDDMEFEYEAVNWEESEDDNRTDVWYVPFASIRHTTWWNSIDKEAVSIFFDFDINCRGFGVKMIPRKSRNGATETLTPQEEEAEFSLYTPKIRCRKDSQYSLMIENFGPYV